MTTQPDPTQARCSHPEGGTTRICGFRPDHGGSVHAAMDVGGEIYTWARDPDESVQDHIGTPDDRAAITARLEEALGPKPWHSDPGEPCEHPHCVAKAAAEAGRADDDVYAAAAMAMLKVDSRKEFDLYQWHPCSRESCKTPCACSGQPWPSAVVRAAIDAARAPLLAELAEVTRERDEARAKAVDGGEWQWGWAWPDTAPDWTHSEAVARQAAAARRPPADVVRRWIGPVEPVTDDSNTEHTYYDEPRPGSTMSP